MLGILHRKRLCLLPGNMCNVKNVCQEAANAAMRLNAVSGQNFFTKEMTGQKSKACKSVVFSFLFVSLQRNDSP